MEILPYSQGDLDAYCGIYSIINAVRLMMPDLSEENSVKVFVKILKNLEGRKKLSHVFANGITPKELSRILKGVMNNGYRITAKQPFLHSKKLPSVEDFAKTVKSFLQEEQGRAVIIDLESFDHWSVVKKITEREIHFFDSSQMKKLHLKRCTTKEGTPGKSHYIDPRQTFFLSRK
jgi:hypothetical protein